MPLSYWPNLVSLILMLCFAAPDSSHLIMLMLSWLTDRVDGFMIGNDAHKLNGNTTPERVDFFVDGKKRLLSKAAREKYRNAGQLEVVRIRKNIIDEDIIAEEEADAGGRQDIAMDGTVSVESSTSTSTSSSTSISTSTSTQSGESADSAADNDPSETSNHNEDSSENSSTSDDNQPAADLPRERIGATDDWNNPLFQQKLRAAYNKLVGFAILSHELGCETPNTDAPKGNYDVEQNEDGYWRLRFPKGYQKDADGNDIYRLLNRSNKDGSPRTTNARTRVRGAIYVHHLSMLANDQSILSQDNSQRFTVSHLCGNPACFNHAHLCLEPHWINIARIGCYCAICPHFPKCLRLRA